MAQDKAKNGDTVRVHYTGKTKDGMTFDSSLEGGEPLEFIIGEGRVIPDFETAIVGMKIGEAKTFEISADKAFGPRREENVVEIDRNRFPDDVQLNVGEQLYMNTPGGTIPVTILDVSETTVTLDANHPLAGEDLTFTIELVDIQA
jgi:FKBP-type peptidyl-prolyl cis-trans isomerase 2